MTYADKYTELDGEYHIMGQGEHTECNLPIPHGNGWTYAPPEGETVHCGELKTEAKGKKK